MVYELILVEEAERDVDEAVLWYEEQQTGLGIRFYFCLLQILDKLRTDPQFYFNIREGYRRIVIDPFPYNIIYKIYDSTVVVLAVFHQHRNPAELLKRLKG